jgi:ribosomal protein S18 acetylase RimI-like enzyme
MEFRKTAQSDYSGVLRLYEQFNRERISLGIGDVNYEYLMGENPWIQTLKDDDFITYVIVRGAVVLGFITVKPFDLDVFKLEGKMAEIDLIIVEEKLRRRHIGSIIFSKVLGKLKSRGYDSVLINVSVLNKPALAFWNYHGFKELSATDYTHANGKRERTLFMVKKINNLAL